MNTRLFLSAITLTVAVCASAAVSVDGTSNFVNITPPATSGLQSVIVVEDASVVTLGYSASSASAAQRVRWKRFSNLGGGYAQDVASTVSGSVSSIRPGSDDMGYIVEDESGRQTAYWLVNYANHLPTMTGFAVSDESECDRTFFTPTGAFDRIVYYSVNGAPIELDRQVKLTYHTLECDQSDEPVNVSWQQVTATRDLAFVNGTFSVEAPLCDTDFTLTGDRFLSQWGKPLSLSTVNYATRRVDARTWAVQTERDISNESNSATSGLGGSAPCQIQFTALPTDAVVFHEWQFSTTEDFADVLYRYNDYIVDYTFTEYGTMYVRFVCADASGACEYTGDVYTVMVGESKLECPNAFSPANEDGVNDEWKVSYSSIVSYECHIFSRWGKEVFSSRNPAEGWDGRIGGKFAPSGVYFYVIKAEGADGHHYNLSGDINIVGSKLNPNATNPTE